MKKLISMLLALVMILSLAACAATAARLLPRQKPANTRSP